MKRILVTGAAGFIGYHLIERLLNRGDVVVGIDSLNDYYDPSLKMKRIELLQKSSSKNSEQFSFQKIDISDLDLLIKCFAQGNFDTVINLAAQAGV